MYDLWTILSSFLFYLDEHIPILVSYILQYFVCYIKLGTYV